jgi:hypothetical protein
VHRISENAKARKAARDYAETGWQKRAADAETMALTIYISRTLKSTEILRTIQSFV